MTAEQHATVLKDNKQYTQYEMANNMSCLCSVGTKSCPQDQQES